MTKIIKVTIEKKDDLYIAISETVLGLFMAHEAIGVVIKETPEVIRALYKEQYNINVILNEVEREKKITGKGRMVILTYEIKVKKYDGTIVSLEEGMKKLNLIGKSNRKFFEKYLDKYIVKKLRILKRGSTIIKEDFSGLHKLFIDYRTFRITHKIINEKNKEIKRDDINVNDEKDSTQYEEYILAIIKNSLKELEIEKKIN